MSIQLHKNISNKLPQINAAFWVMKIAATTLGETGGDWLSMTVNLGYLGSTLVFFSVFVVALVCQLLSSKHRAFLFWTVIVATSTAGTTMSDYMDRTLGLGYSRGVTILVTILLCLLALWRWNVGTVNVNEIRTRKAEVFYWTTILFSNTLGTALGDFLSDDSGLGFLGSWLLIATILVLIFAVNKFTKINKVFLFWTAFILTRPFGATFGDVLTKSRETGGLNLGRGYSSLVLLAILITTIFISYREKSVLPETTV